jgi:hypothetical protein
MATRSAIIREREDGLFEGVYCHNNGYLEHNGSILREHYRDPEKVRHLIGLGDMSVLAPQVTGTNQCFFYHRDRNEAWENVKPKVSDDLKVLLGRIDQEYAYLFDGEMWHYSKHDGPWEELDGPWEELVKAKNETSARICRDFVITLPISDMTEDEYGDAIATLIDISEEELEGRTYYVENHNDEISDEDIEVLKEKGTW